MDIQFLSCTPSPELAPATSQPGQRAMIPEQLKPEPKAPDNIAPPSSSSKKRKSQEDDPTGKPPQEKRLRRFRPQPPQSFHELFQRATTQTFFVLERKRLGSAECPEEEVEMTGSTGNIYVVHIRQQPSCTCPHFKNGHQCKHWLWVMSRVLRADFNYVYQLALLSEELRAIFAAAPPIENPEAAGGDRNRKPVEGDCPICYNELEKPGGGGSSSSSSSSSNIVWCRAACGNNLHKRCLETWARTKRASGSGKVTCPLCRSVWEGDSDLVKNIQKNKPPNSDGYVNVADQLGISSKRDYSSYYSHRGYRDRGWRYTGRY